MPAPLLRDLTCVKCAVVRGRGCVRREEYYRGGTLRWLEQRFFEVYHKGALGGFYSPLEDHLTPTTELDLMAHTRTWSRSNVFPRVHVAGSGADITISDDVRVLSFLVLLALALRLSSLMLFTGSIDWEGAEYARLAENLRAGIGYVGIDLPGKNLMFPPLYPILIAGLSFVTPDVELAARLISVVMGAATVIPAFLLARELFDARVGRIAALIVAVHPLLVHFSATACSEATFIFFLTLASYFTCKAFYAQRAAYFAAAGALFGLAYLTRIEGAPLVGIAFVVSLVVAYRCYGQHCYPRESLMADIRRCLLMPAVFVLIAAPYIIFLHSETGQWRLEGKSPLNIQTAEHVLLANEDKWKVHFEVDSDLNERGIWNRPYNDTIQTANFNLAVFARYIAAKVQSISTIWLVGTVLGLTPDGIAFGTPLLFLLSAIGLLHAVRTRKKIAGQCLLGGFVAIFLFQVLLVVFHNVRYLIPLILPMSVWAAAGVPILYAWVTKRLATAESNTYFTPARTHAFIGLALGAMLIATHVVALGRTPLSRFDESWRPVVVFAQSLAEAKPTTRPVFVGQNTTAFYANADYCPFPYADETTALRYFDKRGVSTLP